MASFDYDVVIIGSGFGGSVAALRAAEKGYRVGVMESGRRWKDEDIPKTQWDLPHFLWFPAAELYGIQRIEYLDDVLDPVRRGRRRRLARLCQHAVCPAEAVLRRAGMGGHHRLGRRAGAVLSTRRGGCSASSATRTCRPTSIGTCSRSRSRWAEARRSTRPRWASTSAAPGVEADDPYFGGVGPRRTGCISCGNCNIGCGHNAKNKLTTNYLYLAEKLGAEVHELHEVYDLVPLDGGGFEVHARHPGWAQRAAHRHHHTYTAEQVIVAAHAYGSAKLLHHMQHKGRLTGLSSELGQRARTNSEQLLAVTRTHGEWERDPERIHITPGSVSITSGVWPDAVTSIEPVYWGVGKRPVRVARHLPPARRAEAPDRVAGSSSWSSTRPRCSASATRATGRSGPSIMLCMQTTDTSIELYWHDGLLRSRHGSGTPPSVHIPVIEEFVDRLAGKMGSREGALLFEVINRNASAHFVGGIPIGDSSESGAVDPYLRLFGQPGLHVMDGSVMPANPGVNPSLTITALAERAMSLWPNKGEADTRPPLGSGYERVDPVMPHRPVVPAGAPGELRLDAKKADVIPDYPY